MTGATSYLFRAEEYLELRRGLGFELVATERHLLEFAGFLDRHAPHGPLTVDLALRWVTSVRSRDPGYLAIRLSAVRGFARHLVAFDQRTEIPPRAILGRARRKPPHIYSDEEISALLHAAAGLRPKGGLRSHAYVAYFALLASTGLRMAEACRLLCADVDLADGVMTIREGKFRKSRLVPLHHSAVAALVRYASRRDRLPGVPRSDHFFRTDASSCLTPRAVFMTFRRLRRQLGWPTQGRTRLPRLHDLRHTFAVRRLLDWQLQGIDVDRKIAALSTYLGHARVTDTYWYLTALPELLAVSAQRFDRFAHQEQERVP